LFYDVAVNSFGDIPINNWENALFMLQVQRYYYLLTSTTGLGGMPMQMMPGFDGQMQNPYGMAMNGQQQQILAGQGMGRRYS
jgi:hypothetical protein